LGSTKPKSRTKPSPAETVDFRGIGN